MNPGTKAHIKRHVVGNIVIHLIVILWPRQIVDLHAVPTASPVANLDAATAFQGLTLAEKSYVALNQTAI
jgi:hypothetical protein